MRKISFWENTKRAFTLSEVLVVIAIIWILALVGTRLDFSRISIKQEINTKVIEIESIVTEVRNNALIWKWFGTPVEIPTDWDIIVENNTSSGSIEVYASGALYKSWVVPENMAIQDILCQNFNGTSQSVASATLSFTGSELDITNWCNPSNNHKILSIIYGQTSLTWSISVNTTTGVISRNPLP